MKTYLIICLTCFWFSAFADTATNSAYNIRKQQLVKSEATPIVARTESAPSGAQRPTIKVEGVMPAGLTTNQPTRGESPLELKIPVRSRFWDTGVFNLPKGIMIGFDLQPKDPPYPRDSGGSALFLVSFPFEKKR